MGRVSKGVLIMVFVTLVLVAIEISSAAASKGARQQDYLFGGDTTTIPAGQSRFIINGRDYKSLSCKTVDQIHIVCEARRY